jgi:choline dehydrogenase-like flavoprotein
MVQIMRSTKEILDIIGTTYPFSSALSDFSNTEAIKGYILGSAFSVANAGSGYHFAGTCKMGSSSDSTAVVDNRLRVFGVRNLRVADASIMPSVTTGNTQAPTYMIGEKASDMILADNN